MSLVDSKTAFSILSYRGPNRDANGLLLAAGGVASAFVAVRDFARAGWYYLSGNQFCYMGPDHFEEKVLCILPRNLVAAHYRFCNSVLWPLAHMHHSKAVYRDTEYDAYVNLQRRIVQVIRRHNPAQQIFVQDYQFYLVPRLLESVGIKSIFFLHTPYPELPALYNKFNETICAITRGLLSSSVIGLHTIDYQESIMKFAAENLPGLDVDVDGKLITRQNGATTELVVAPLGVDHQFWQQFRQPVASSGKKEFLIVCRADYSKGVTELLDAWSIFHRDYPVVAGECVLRLVVTESRTEIDAFDQELRRIYQAIERLHSQLGEDFHNLVIWHKKAVPQQVLAGLYAKADCILSPAWKDGMNLTILEYIMAQFAGRGGMVGISESTGVFSLIGDHCVTLTPEDPMRMARAFFNMSMHIGTASAQRRMAAMQALVPTLGDWWTKFAMLAGVDFQSGSANGPQ